MNTIGVLGGMGPAATAHFLGRLVVLSSAAQDQDYPPCLVYSASHIPDRTTHLVGGGEDPTPALQAAARVLEAGGAGAIAMPCNTAHAYLDAVRTVVGVPVLDMIDLAAKVIAASHPGSTVGVLAATGTVRLGLYQAALQANGLEVVQPDEVLQDEVMEAIRDVKAGGSGRDRRLDGAIQILRDRGAEVLILGCTELPLAVDPASTGIPVVDATDVLARACLEWAGGSVRP
jgi:aspartate racemase